MTLLHDPNWQLSKRDWEKESDTVEHGVFCSYEHTVNFEVERKTQYGGRSQECLKWQSNSDILDYRLVLGKLKLGFSLVCDPTGKFSFQPDVSETAVIDETQKHRTCKLDFVIGSVLYTSDIYSGTATVAEWSKWAMMYSKLHPCL